MKITDFTKDNATAYKWNIIKCFLKKKEIGTVMVKEDWHILAAEEVNNVVTQRTLIKGSILPLYQDFSGVKIIRAIECASGLKHYCLLEEAPVEVIK